MTTRKRIVFALFPDVTQLDFTGPLEVLSRLPDSQCVLAATAGGTLRASGGVCFSELVRLEDVEDAWLLCVPGGYGTVSALTDERYLRALARLARSATYVSSVCTGSLLLGAAGLLRGRRAACHWAWRELLVEFGALPDPGRVVRDGNLFTGGGVTAGIDLALSVVLECEGSDFAKSIQLALEYAPAPPLDAGTPEGAGPDIVRRVRAQLSRTAPARLAAVRAAAERASSLGR